uniref:Uncharacterized protein n=1 Tax=Cacopsylla melanoneura TaxID=428564 RepID=A0A8D8V682_9HEMI
MGNSSSSHRDPPSSHSWTLSYPPRTHPAHPNQKVLPERYPPGQRLRVTNNGVLLHTVGTLNRHAYNGYPVPVARFGSEPDLRFTGREFMSYGPPPPSHHTTEFPLSKQKISRSRKKYKAPAPAVTNGLDSSSPDSYQAWDTSAENSEVQAPPTRKSRLFKTHAETKGPAARMNKIPPLHRSLSSPQFHEELLEATQKLRHQQRHRSKSPSSALDNMNNTNHSNNSNLSNGNHGNGPLSNGNHANGPLSNDNHGNGVLSNGNYGNGPLSNGNHGVLNNAHLDSTKNSVQPPPRLHRGIAKEKQITPNIRKLSSSDNNVYLYNNNSNKENMPNSANQNQKPNQSQQQEMKEIVKEDNMKTNWDNIKPVKTFYFGMEEEDLRQKNNNNNESEMDRFAAEIHHRHSPVSDGVEEDMDINNISLHLRPTLPRKQLDIPRFSPTAAWRLLSSLESPPLSHQSEGEEDDLVVPHVTDKSVDSGISGDASPHLYSAQNSQAAWTPQQDLEETSSDGGLESAPVTPETMGAPTFSLSLPRDSHNAKHSFTMLQSHGWMSELPSAHNTNGVISSSRDGRDGGGSSLVDENWVLSRSVPSSLHLQRWVTEPSTDQDRERDSLGGGQSLPYFARSNSGGGRVMYLPEYQPSRIPHSMQDMTGFSKSCDNLLVMREREREELTETDIELESVPLTNQKQGKKSKKFTFQSTVRQIERRRIAEKLSKQAEQKERQRLMELATMQRVEAEFQRKREREKADIRQQLRLYTHVLSEYKQPSRDYKDYTPQVTRSDVPESPPSQVIHPQVVYQMPKNTQVYVVANGNNNVASNTNNNNSNTPITLSDSSNYRRNFAQGVTPRSGSELSQPITNRSSSQDDESKDKMSSDNNSNQVTKSEPFPLLPDHKYSLPPPTQLPPDQGSKPLKPSHVLTSLLQPFDPKKSYRPITFSPNPTATQIVS